MDTTFLERVIGLSQQQYLAAEKAAAEIIVAMLGKRPERKNYRRRAWGKYPIQVVLIVIALIVILVITTFIISAIRLYDIGSKTFQEGINHAASAQWAGGSMILMAETAAILFILARSVIDSPEIRPRFPGERWLIWRISTFDPMQAIMLALALLATAIALAGNYYVAIDQRQSNLFAWLEALVPPVFTLGASYILERLFLEMIKNYHADQLEYEHDTKAYDTLAVNPKSHPDYRRVLARAIWDQILLANSDKRRKHEGESFYGMLVGLNQESKAFLVRREYAAHEWGALDTPIAKEADSHPGMGFLRPALSPVSQ